MPWNKCCCVLCLEDQPTNRKYGIGFKNIIRFCKCLFTCHVCWFRPYFSYWLCFLLDYMYFLPPNYLWGPDVATSPEWWWMYIGNHPQMAAFQLFSGRWSIFLQPDILYPFFSRYSTRELIAWPSGLVCVKQSPSATQVDIFPNGPTCESAIWVFCLIK